jgi:arylsulfatase A-like enzyme
MTNLHQGYETFREPGNLGEQRDDDIPAKAARHYVDDLLGWVETRRDVPFFAFLHVEDPHSPYFAPPPHDTRWGAPGDPARYRDLQNQVRPNIDHPLMRQFGMPETADLTETGIDPDEYVALELDAYDGLIRSLDAEIGRLVERLEQLGLRDRVLLAFVSDHGTEFLEHGRHFHGHSVYGELNRVPMFFWGPGFVPAGVRVPGVVQNLDFMPTVLEVAGLEVPEAAQGHSLVPWFTARSEAEATAAGWPRRPAVTEKAFLQFREKDGYASAAIISDGWKLIVNYEPPAGVPKLELYSYDEDPLDTHDVAEAHPDEVERLSRLLKSWKMTAEADTLPSDATLGEGVSAEELERLRALGYI